MKNGLTALGIIAILHAWTLLGIAQAQPCGRDDALCGPRSLLAVFSKLNIESSLDEIERLSDHSARMGSNLLGLKRAAEAKCLHAVGMKIGAEEISMCTVPAIAHLWGDHFVLVEGSEPGILMVTEPPAEPKAMPAKEFAKVYSGFALLIAKDESAFPKSEPKGPDLRVDAYNWDIGFIEQGDQAGHTFVLENKGVEDLVLSKVETNCSCTNASLPNGGTIRPDGKAELAVGFDSTAREGGQDKIVYVYSNDPISPVVQLRVSGVVKPTHLPISTRNLNLGVVKKRNTSAREFSIRDPGDRLLAVGNISSDSPLIKTTVTKNEKDGLVYLVKAELQPGAPIGEFKSKITVHSNHPREPVVEIPVTAEVVGDLETFPNQFFLGLLKKGQSVSKTISISTTANESFKIKKVVSPFDYVTVKSEADTKGKKYNITATIKGSAPLGLIRGEVEIKTNNKDQPEIKMPLYALIEE